MPKVSAFSIGDSNLLKLEVQHISEKQYTLQITNRQDYENENQRYYGFEIILPNINKPFRWSLNIIDIDDVAPTIIAVDTPCIIEENKAGPSDCTFNIYDPDSDTVTYKFDKFGDIFTLKDENTNPGVKPTDKTARLHVIKALDFETQPMYSFNIIASDNEGNEGSTIVIIKVKDVSDMPPMWITIFATKTFDEHDTTQVYKVFAKDGDIEVNAPIKYEFADGCNDKISVDEFGEIRIGDIDRDKPELVDNTIKCTIIAYEDDEIHNTTSSEIVFIVRDINDNIPEITLLEPEICMNEGEAKQFDNIFSVNDIDQGANSQYDLMILDNGNYKYAEAFQIIPSSGYRNLEFSMTVLNAKLLDYDNADWRNFELTIKAIDKGTPSSQEDMKTIKVCLYNMNNNEPKFVTEDFTVHVPENVKENYKIIDILATDKDTDDFVSYEITMGQDKFKYIDGNTKDDPITVFTKKDKVFDYEKQTEVFFQITIHDNLNATEGIVHKVSQQVTIIVDDINDEKPRITLLSTETPEVKEHSANYEIKDVFEAEDVDTDAELEFSILWKDTYGMKEGKKITDRNIFENVFKIVPEYEKLENGDENKGKAKASLVVNDEKKLDWEEFEILYLKIQVEDIKQVENKPGIDVATMAIIIVDINDNPPILKEPSDKFRVVEEADEDILIGSVLATDKDGPGNNEIIYELTPIDGTKDGLIKINEITGEIRVDQKGKIDADCPKTEKLSYILTAKDPNKAEFFDTKNLYIAIDDTNNKIPRLVEELYSVDFLEEKTSEKGVPIIKIKATDDDRDDPHNKLIYEINGERNLELLDYFDIGNTGNVYVLQPLLWTRQKQSIEVDVNIKDNKGLAGYNNLKASFTVNIIDIDNNSPKLSNSVNYEKISEATEPETFFAKITATDADKPCTDATKIDYKITKIVKITEDIEENIEVEEILRIDTLHENEDNGCLYYGNVITNKNLIGFYGKFRMTVTATNPKPENKDTKDYNFEITPFNFREPSISNPLNAKIILMNEQKIDDVLIQIDFNPLKPFTATDNQGDKFPMTLSLETIQGEDIFKFKAAGKSAAQLQLKKLPESDDTVYKINVMARHSGTGNSTNYVEKTYDIYFLDKAQSPFFDVNDATLDIEENDELYCGSFPEAVDPKCSIRLSEDCTFITYYYILTKTEFFHIPDSTEPKICVKQPLDYETQTIHELIIGANNDPIQPPLDAKNALKLIVNVIDVNDEPPIFDTDVYLGGMRSGLTLNTEILTVHATDIDTVDTELRYEIVKDSIQISDDSLVTAKDNPFILDSKTGLIRNNFSPVVDMKGYLLFQVIVFDSDDLHNDTADVKISIIRNENIISFTFNNDVDLVKAKSLQVRDIFTNELQYNCSIDGINKKTEAGVAIDNQTEVTTHFINPASNEPVPEADITAKTSDMETISRLLLRFEDIDLELNGIKKNVEKEIENMENLLRILLIVVSVVLGSLIIILIIAFVLRTRSLNKRLESMTTNIFGSTKSDLNRIGHSAPGTNKHAVEANPVWNTDLHNGKQFDSMSQTSGGSDLIGIEDNPEFQYSNNNRRDSINPMYHNNKTSTSFENEDDDDIHSLPGSNI